MKRYHRFSQQGLVLALFIFFFAQVAYAQSGNWLELDGVDDYASIDDNSTLDIGNGTTDDFTIECFFYIPDLNGDLNQILIYKTWSYSLFLNTNTSSQDVIIFRLYPSSVDYVQILNSMDLSVGWHHIAAVYDNEYTADNDAMYIFLDGTRIGSTSAFEITPGAYNSSNALNIGANTGVVPFHGRIDEVRISDIIRYSGESYSVPSSDFSVDENTRALWHFSEDVGATSFSDATANNNTLTGHNGAAVLPVEEEAGFVSNKFDLSQNYPNPFNASTIISFNSPMTSFISLKVFDLIGKEVATIVFEELPAGNYSREWNAGGLSSGVYLYRLQAGSFIETKKLILLK